MSDRVWALAILAAILIGWGGVATWKRHQVQHVLETCQEVAENNINGRVWARTYDCPDGSTHVVM